jgi:hypothetical protein
MMTLFVSGIQIHVMKEKFRTKLVVMTLSVVLFIAGGCLKDKVNYTYTLHLPVYKSLTAVRAGMKTDPASAIGTTGKLYIKGNYIFLNELEKGIHIIDNSNPAHPVNIGFINIPGNENIAIRDATLYADAYSDLVAFDISNPLHVQTKKILPNIFPDRNIYYYNSGANPDSIQVIVDWITKDTTVNYDTYRRYNYYGYPGPVLFAASASSGGNQTGTGTGGSMARFTIVNDYLYAVSFSDLNVFAISNRNDPVFANKTQIDWHIETIYPFKDKLFIGGNTGMYMYDISSTPENPTAIGQFTHARSCDPVIADNDYAYVTLSDGTPCLGIANQLDIVDIKNLSSPTLKKTYPMTHPEGLSKDNTTLFICDGKDGLKVFNTTDVNDIKLIKKLNEGEPIDVITANGLAVVVAKDGLYEYDYSDLNNIHLVGKLLSNNK